MEVPLRIGTGVRLPLPIPSTSAFEYEPPASLAPRFRAERLVLASDFARELELRGLQPDELVLHAGGTGELSLGPLEREPVASVEHDSFECDDVHYCKHGCGTQHLDHDHAERCHYCQRVCPGYGR